jgi:hypothetical protein
MSLSNFVSKDSDSLKLDQEMKEIIRKHITGSINLHTIVLFNDSLRKINFVVQNLNPSIHIETPTTYKLCNIPKKEVLSIDLETHKIDEIAKLPIWGPQHVLEDKDTLIDGKKYRFIKLAGTKNEKTNMLFIDPGLPKNLSPAPTGFAPSLNIEGGVFKRVIIDHNNNNNKMTETLKYYEKIEGTEIVYPQKKIDQNPQ